MAKNKTYPIGTPVIFIAHRGMCTEAQQDNGKKGEVIGTTSYGKARIKLFGSSAKSRGRKNEWVTSWNNIKPVVLKNEQLLFDFAY